jgi:7-cyano-7-deazaguanine synthase
MPVIALSGGLDSSVVLALALATHPRPDIETVIFDYGQPAFPPEMRAATMVCGSFGLPAPQAQSIAVLPDISPPDLPPGGPRISAYETDESKRKAIRRHNFLPYRNLALAIPAVLTARKLGLPQVWFGFHRGLTLANCPDATTDFVAALNQTLALSVLGEDAVEIVAPLHSLLKEEVVRLGLSLKVPIELTYSCYEASPCDSCPNCYHRQQALAAAQ